MDPGGSRELGIRGAATGRHASLSDKLTHSHASWGLPWADCTDRETEAKGGSVHSLKSHSTASLA